jgi:hypothetical protein
LTYEQLGLRPKILVLSYDPHGVRKLQSEPRYACLWTNSGHCSALYN